LSEAALVARALDTGVHVKGHYSRKTSLAARLELVENRREERGLVPADTEAALTHAIHR
jgi:hypothetical protein